MELGLKEAVTSAYLCMRAIDEIEDHDELEDSLKIELLIGIQKAFQSPNAIAAIQNVLSPYKAILPAVTMQLDEWAQLC